MQDFLRQIIIIWLLIGTWGIGRWGILFFIRAIVDFRGLGPPMTMIKCAHRLRQHLPYEIFTDIILRFSTPSYELLQIAAVAMLHDYKYFSFMFINNSIVVLNDIRVV